MTTPLDAFISSLIHMPDRTNESILKVMDNYEDLKKTTYDFRVSKYNISRMVYTGGHTLISFKNKPDIRLSISHIHSHEYIEFQSPNNTIRITKEKDRLYVESHVNNKHIDTIIPYNEIYTKGGIYEVKERCLYVCKRESNGSRIRFYSTKTGDMIFEKRVYLFNTYDLWLLIEPGTILDLDKCDYELNDNIKYIGLAMNISHYINIRELLRKGKEKNILNIKSDIKELENVYDYECSAEIKFEVYDNILFILSSHNTALYAGFTTSNELHGKKINIGKTFLKINSRNGWLQINRIDV